MLHKLWAALSDREPHLEALFTEGTVKAALRSEGHHVTDLGFWALRHQKKHKDALFATLTMKKGWSWLVFSVTPPQSLSALDQKLLIALLEHLHGVQLVSWHVAEDTVTYQHWNLNVAQVGHRKILNQKSGKRISASLKSRGAAFPEHLLPLGEDQLLAALLELYYVDHVAAGRPGDFTNIDVLALAQDQPVVIEVKRRTRAEEKAFQPLTLSLTQGQTLAELNRQAKCEVHVVVLTVSVWSEQAQWLTEGTWYSCGIQLQREWTRFLLKVHHPVAAPTLAALRENRQALLLPEAPQQLALPVEPATRVKVVPPPKRPAREVKTRLKTPPRLVSYTEEYAFLDIWSPVAISLRGMQFPSLAAAYLAAHTTDAGARESLAGMTQPRDALRTARRMPIREDWPELRDEAARRIMTAAFRGERAQQLVKTLPFRLADSAVTDKLLREVQGRKGNQFLEHLRGQLVGRLPLQGCCGGCVFAQVASIPGFTECHHPGGEQATQECVGRQAYRFGGQAVCAMTTPGGKHYRAQPQPR